MSWYYICNDVYWLYNKQKVTFAFYSCTMYILTNAWKFAIIALKMLITSARRLSSKTQWRKQKIWRRSGAVWTLIPCTIGIRSCLYKSWKIFQVIITTFRFHKQMVSTQFSQLSIEPNTWWRFIFKGQLSSPSILQNFYHISIFCIIVDHLRQIHILHLNFF